ncbi:hypothetical protein DM860_017795 [Cuscuta australis]|uniref:Uncharacterized protein n=1 Tax=Cuscuta australis TaxID=267555 RepID=A0A328DU31_9ASTE|nr:hypothetical protein DM860_017795 [Cuscuta australis]
MRVLGCCKSLNSSSLMVQLPRLLKGKLTDHYIFASRLILQALTCNSLNEEVRESHISLFQRAIKEVCHWNFDSPIQAYDPPSSLDPLPLALPSVLSPNALEFVPSNPTTTNLTALKESNISFRGCSLSDIERDNNWSTSKAYDSDFEHMGYANKQVHLEEESEWETDNGEENEGREDWHARKTSLNKKNLAKFEHLSKQFQGGTHSKPRRSNRLASLRIQLIEENNLP